MTLWQIGYILHINDNVANMNIIRLVSLSSSSNLLFIILYGVANYTSNVTNYYYCKLFSRRHTLFILFQTSRLHRHATHRSETVITRSVTIAVYLYLRDGYFAMLISVNINTFAQIFPYATTN